MSVKNVIEFYYPDLRYNESASARKSSRDYVRATRQSHSDAIHIACNTIGLRYLAWNFLQWGVIHGISYNHSHLEPEFELHSQSEEVSLYNSDLYFEEDNTISTRKRHALKRSSIRYEVNTPNAPLPQRSPTSEMSVRWRPKKTDNPFESAEDIVFEGNAEGFLWFGKLLAHASLLDPHTDSRIQLEPERDLVTTCDGINENRSAPLLITRTENGRRRTPSSRRGYWRVFWVTPLTN